MTSKTPEYDNFKSWLAPKTFYEELAQHGDLFTFVQSYLPEVFDNDENFRKRIYSLILQNSPEIVPEIEGYLLGELQQSFAYFLDRTESCRK